MKLYRFLYLFLLPFFLCMFSSPSLNALSYEHVHDTSISIHILTIDPQEHTIIPVRASGQNIERETVAALAKKHGAIAALNGGFWKKDGTPAGILKINHQWHATPSQPRGAIGWSESDKQVLMDRLLTSCSLDECTNENQIELLPQLNRDKTAGKKWKECTHIVGGSPLLVSNGYPIDNFKPEKTRSTFLTKQRARTAVGIKENGDWVFVVVDGTFPLKGMTVQDLASFISRLGCIDALNLDGGSSSTLVLDNQVVNEPHGTILEEGKWVEAVSDAFLIFPK